MTKLLCATLAERSQGQISDFVPTVEIDFRKRRKKK
jgi:hypothetical protein